MYEGAYKALQNKARSNEHGPIRVIFHNITLEENAAAWLIVYELYQLGETLERRCALVSHNNYNEILWDNPIRSVTKLVSNRLTIEIDAAQLNDEELASTLMDDIEDYATQRMSELGLKKVGAKLNFD